MPQQKNGPLFTTLAIFMLFAVGMGVAWYLAQSDATASRANLVKAQNEKSTAENAVRALQNEKNSLLELIGRKDAQDANAVATELTERLDSDKYSDLTEGAKSMELALDKAATDRDMQAGSANQRQVDLQKKIDEMENAIESKDKEIAEHRQGQADAENELQKRVAAHSENIDNLNKEFTELRNDYTGLQEEHDTYVTETDRTVLLLENDNREKREAIRALRRRMFEKDDVSFATADGLISHVDQLSKRAHINLGSKDELQVGTTFSVYMSKHNGIGRRDSSDIKASIEVLAITGPHLAVVRITRQDLDRPVATGDPIYSPIFTAGVRVEIAIAGLIDFDGSPGSDRSELLRMITDRGARVNVQIDDEGNFADSKGERMSKNDASASISERTRFLVIGDLGKDADEDSKDVTRLKTYAEIQKKTGFLQEQAENHGVYEIGMSAFLEFLGYTKKRTVWRAEQTFVAPPVFLANGSKSSSVSSSIGNRESAGQVSPLFSKRKRPNPASQGVVSELYR
jgi:predicted  nucleic acid-binding Zn-ribbon protein